MVNNKNIAGENFSYPEARKKLTLLLCHKGMVTCSKYIYILIIIIIIIIIITIIIIIIII